MISLVKFTRTCCHPSGIRSDDVAVIFSFDDQCSHHRNKPGNNAALDLHDFMRNSSNQDIKFHLANTPGNSRLVQPVAEYTCAESGKIYPSQRNFCIWGPLE